MSDTPTSRHDGWTPGRQRTFLETLSVGGVVRRAATAAGMSHEAAYRLRHRREGAAFRIGWDAALLLARIAVADMLLDRAIEGQEDVIVRDEDGRTRTHHRHDNRLGLALLGRLDRLADDGHVARADARAASENWEAFLALIDTDPDADGIAGFLGEIRAPTEALEPCQLRGERDGEGDDDDDDYGDGDDALAIDPESAWMRECFSVWWDEAAAALRTNFPPPEGFEGYQLGEPTPFLSMERRYERALTAFEDERETDILQARLVHQDRIVEGWRRAWFQMTEDETGGVACALAA